MPRDNLPEVGKSAFLASSRNDIFQAIAYLLQEDILSVQSGVLDLGSGAGDVTAITSYVFGLPSIGIEYDSTLVEYASEMSSKLEKELGESPLYYIQGDYTDTSPIDWDAIDLIYNYFSGSITEVLNEALGGTYFMSYNFGDTTHDLLTANQISNRLHNTASFQQLDFTTKHRIKRNLHNQYEPWNFLLRIPGSNLCLWKK